MKSTLRTHVTDPSLKKKLCIYSVNYVCQLIRGIDFLLYNLVDNEVDGMEFILKNIADPSSEFMLGLRMNNQNRVRRREQSRIEISYFRSIRYMTRCLKFKNSNS